jgi:chromosome segregation ATPase
VSRKVILALTLIAMLAGFCGCESALLNMRKENEQSEVRVQAKEQQLQELQGEEIQLNEKKKGLLSDLRNRQMEYDSLNSSLEDLRMQNASISADTAAKRNQKADLDKRLKGYEKKLATVKNDTGSTEAEKKKKIEELKREIKLYLEMGLK